MYLVPDWPAPSHIKAYTTLRTAWSQSPSGRFDSPLPLPEEPIWIKQTHSAIAVEARLENSNCVADAIYTNKTKRVCAVLTADCLPILICNQAGTHVAAIHAGWRGIASGIIEATIKSLNTPSNELLVWLGPAIGPEKFEIRRDVYDIFTKSDAESKKGFTIFSDESWLANIYSLAKIRLERCGILQIYGGRLCTYTDPDRFFSYRRDKEKTGSMVSLIWIMDSVISP